LYYYTGFLWFKKVIMSTFQDAQNKHTPNLKTPNIFFKKSWIIHIGNSLSYLWNVDNKYFRGPRFPDSRNTLVTYTYTAFISVTRPIVIVPRWPCAWSPLLQSLFVLDTGKGWGGAK